MAATKGVKQRLAQYALPSSTRQQPEEFVIENAINIRNEIKCRKIVSICENVSKMDGLRNETAHRETN
jgi:hypothetical protein